MRRPAVPDDLPALLGLCEAAGRDALSDPALVTEVLLRRLIAVGTVMVQEEDGVVVGFAVLDSGAVHLLVDPAQRSKGIGRELLSAACAALKETGHPVAILTLAPGSAAERHYRAAGWTETGKSPKGGLVIKKKL